MTTSTTQSPKRRIHYVRRRPADAPGGAAVERERAMWGPHPDPAVGRIEGAFYQVGFEFLTALYAGAMGVAPPRKLAKALGPRGVAESIPPADWGALAESYKKAGNPMELRDEWARLIDRLVGRLLPGKTQEEMANRVAIQAHWLGRVRAKTEELATAPPPEDWVHATAPLPRFQHEAMEWTKVHALEGCKSLEEGARKGLMSALITSRQAGEGAQALARRCFDGFSDLNRDWRRLALTETAAAVFNGQLAAVDPDEGWEAEWITAVGACEWCMAWKGHRFRIVKPDDPRRNGQTDLWVGKTNHGRSGAAKTKEGRPRSTNELYWPCQPVHPNCSCSLTFRRQKRP